MPPAKREAATAAAEAQRTLDEAVLAEEKAEDVADPWWDCEARVPRHQVPVAPDQAEPERRLDVFYLLEHENRKAKKRDDGGRGGTVTSTGS